MAYLRNEQHSVHPLYENFEPLKCEIAVLTFTVTNRQPRT